MDATRPTEEQESIRDAVNRINQLAAEGQRLLSRLSKAPGGVRASSMGAAATGSNAGPRLTNSSSSLSISESVRNLPNSQNVASCAMDHTKWTGRSESGFDDILRNRPY